MSVDSFVARDEELSEVIAVLGHSRLVTLTGPAGVGKTRLALEVATRVAPHHPDGAVFVALATIRDPDLVPAAVAAALFVQEQPGRPLTDTLVQALRHRRILVVLDNCEHLVGAVARLADALLRGSGGLTILATSQENLCTAGERAWLVPPLGVPDAGSNAPEALAVSPAVRLFCERATAVRPGFTLSADVAPAVGEICRRLDGVALAIELAAARVAVLAPAEIAARLGDRFALLTGGSRAALPRHHSLQTAMEWSYELLSGPEAAVLRRLSVFAGGCGLRAAEEVCAGGEVAPGEVLGMVAALVGKSLVVADSSGDETRYRLLETVNHFAGDRLAEAEELPSLRSRHAQWFTGLAERAEVSLTGPDQQRWLTRLEADHDNLRAALEWAIAGGESTVALRLAGSLTLFWRVRGYFGEGRDYQEASLALAEGVPATLRAKALWGAGFLAHMLAEDAAAVTRLEEAARLFEHLGDVSGRARSLLLLGNTRATADPMLAVLEQSATLAREADDDWCLSHALALQALTHINQSEPAIAGPLLADCLAVARRSRDSQSLRIGLTLAGDLAIAMGDYEEAESVLCEALAVNRELGDPYGTSGALISLGERAVWRGEYQGAEELLDEAVALARWTGEWRLVVDALCRRAWLARAVGDLARAALLLEEADSVAEEAGRTNAPALRGLGEVALARGDVGVARALVEKALAGAAAAGWRREVAAGLSAQASLARQEGHLKSAAVLHHEALEIRSQAGYVPEIVESLEALGTLAAESGRRRWDHAARMLGAAQALRQRCGYRRFPSDRPRHDASVATLQQGLGPEALAAAWAQGEAMTMHEAVSHAARGRGAKARTATGWSSLTRAEREVALLVSEGLTNARIGEQLFISPGTVKGHLSNMFTKLGVTSRVDVAQEVWRQRSSVDPSGGS